MPLNNFADEEAIELVIALRDSIPLDYELPLQERWKEKDALAQVINLASERAKEKKANAHNQ